MHRTRAICASLFLALAACNQALAPTEAGAQSAGTVAPGGDIPASERTAILAALNMRANSAGQVENECGEFVQAQFLAADIGPGPGRVVAFNIGGGPSTISCYGDGSLVIFMRHNNGAWEQIYQNRGGGAIVLPTQHNGGNDIADGGPGFSFPVRHWNGATYVSANRTVADSALGEARFIPN